MSCQRVSLIVVIVSLAFGSWLLALRSQDVSPKPENSNTRYIVQHAGDCALMLDPHHGKTWMLRRQDNGNAIWLPILKIDSEKEASQLWLKTAPYNLAGLWRNERPREISTLLKEYGYEKILLEKFNCGYIGIRMQINEKKVHLILDSGQPVTHLDPERTKHLQLKWKAVGKEEEKNKPRGAASTTDYAATISSLEVGGIKSGEMLVGGHDLSDVNRTLKAYFDPPIDGELGSDVLMKYRAIIDFSTLDLYLRPRK